MRRSLGLVSLAGLRLKGRFRTDRRCTSRASATMRVSRGFLAEIEENSNARGDSTAILPGISRIVGPPTRCCHPPTNCQSFCTLTGGPGMKARTFVVLALCIGIRRAGINFGAASAGRSGRPAAVERLGEASALSFDRMVGTWNIEWTVPWKRVWRGRRHHGDESSIKSPKATTRARSRRKRTRRSDHRPGNTDAHPGREICHAL